MSKLLYWFLIIVMVCPFLANVQGKAWDENTNQSIPGYVIRSSRSHPLIDMQFEFLRTTTGFNDSGEKIDYSNIYNTSSDPQRKFSIARLFLFSSITKRLGTKISIPVILRQKFDFGSVQGTNSLQNLSGDTGFGDIQIGLWYLEKLSDYSRGIVDISFTFPSGSYPLNISENQVSSTGRGNIVTIFRAALDIQASKVLAIGMQGSYLVNIDDAYSLKRINSTYTLGNEVEVNGRLIIAASNILSIGTDFQYGEAFGDKIKGSAIPGSKSRELIITPLIGLHVFSGSMNSDMQIGYRFCVDGKNTPRWQGLYLRNQLYF